MRQVAKNSQPDLLADERIGRVTKDPASACATLPSAFFAPGCTLAMSLEGFSLKMSAQFRDQIIKLASK